MLKDSYSTRLAELKKLRKMGEGIREQMLRKVEDEIRLLPI